MENKLSKHIWIEAEEWAEGEWDIEDDNTDVIVTFPDRSQWIASFFTYNNIQTLRENNKKSGECMNGAYFWSTDIILIDIASRERIVEVIDYLILIGEFEVAFTRCPDVDTEDAHIYPEGFFV